MGWFFNRKSKKIEEAKPAICRHHWKDFPWYYNAIYYTDTKILRAEIIEPYVCIHCKERKNVVLKKIETRHESFDLAKGHIDELKTTYKEYMMDEVLVNDMIADMQLVDREYLAIAEAIANPPKTVVDDPLDKEMKELQQALKNIEKDWAVQTAAT